MRPHTHPGMAAEARRMIERGTPRGSASLPHLQREVPVARKQRGSDLDDAEVEDGLSTGTRMAIGVEGGPMHELVSIAVPDRPLCTVGLALLAKACERCRKVMVALHLDTTQPAERESECQALDERLQDEALSGLGIPLRWVPTLKIGLSLEFQKAQEMVEAQLDLVMDPTDAETRVKQLDRLMSDLDMALMGGATTE